MSTKSKVGAAKAAPEGPAAKAKAETKIKKREGLKWKKGVWVAASVLLLIAVCFISSSLFESAGLGVAALVLFGDGRQMIGSVGGTTFQRGRYGAIARMKTSPVQPMSAAQTAVRNRTAQVSSNWKVLSGSDRLGWENLAASFPTTNRFGQEVFLTGQAFYNMANQNVLQVGEPLLNVASTVDTWVVPGAELAAVITVGDGFTTFTVSDPSNFSDKCVVQMTRPLPQTLNFGSLSREWRKIYADDDGAISTAINAGYEDTFGVALTASTIFPAGYFIYVRFKTVASFSGGASPWTVAKIEIGT